jgi:hypothetical protein
LTPNKETVLEMAALNRFVARRRRIRTVLTTKAVLTRMATMAATKVEPVHPMATSGTSPRMASLMRRRLMVSSISTVPNARMARDDGPKPTLPTITKP